MPDDSVLSLNEDAIFDKSKAVMASLAKSPENKRMQILMMALCIEELPAAQEVAGHFAGLNLADKSAISDLIRNRLERTRGARIPLVDRRP